MPYARIDDQEWTSPDTARMGNAAYGVLCRLRGYCAAYQTDGYVPPEIVAMITAADPTAVDRLEDAGELAWINPAEGLNADENRNARRIAKLTRWLDHNISRDDWEAMKDRRSTAGRKAAKARWGAK